MRQDEKSEAEEEEGQPEPSSSRPVRSTRSKSIASILFSFANHLRLLEIVAIQRIASSAESSGKFPNIFQSNRTNNESQVVEEFPITESGQSISIVDEEDATVESIVDKARTVVRNRMGYVATTGSLSRSIQKLNDRLSANFQELRSVFEERVAIERQIAELTTNQETLEVARHNEESGSD